ncbi:TRAP transporter small permease [Dethiosulfovibrio salsuginis]|uniref:TRAP-type C4-dicarboxylate transport system, small permease component n=1 Tax=Dethiosulfovibrio salsuginis TaxID=561720 RepID=A0A1X7IGV8_9BACT|nr:TRAP transporter small permease [Dethiosulfovibrio salsuginis]SMG13878.1 TRAP-type C4-dicarboxylate transport system, small permease component [Dethiosulfovibrio salsuginis]
MGSWRDLGRIQKLAIAMERLSALVAGFLLLINVGDIVLGILFRYVMKSSIIWTEEVARYSLVWLVMLGAAGAQAKGDHMSIDFLTPRFPRWLKKLSYVVRIGVQAVVLVLLIWLGSKNVAGTWTMKTMALGIPKAIPLMAVPIGISMLLVQLLLQELHRRSDGGDKP